MLWWLPLPWGRTTQRAEAGTPRHGVHTSAFTSMTSCESSTLRSALLRARSHHTTSDSYSDTSSASHATSRHVLPRHRHLQQYHVQVTLRHARLRARERSVTFKPQNVTAMRGKHQRACRPRATSRSRHAASRHHVHAGATSLKTRL